MIKYEEIKKEFPKAFSELYKFYESSIKDMQESLLKEMQQDMEPGEEEFSLPELTKDIIESNMSTIINSNGLKDLFIFFDRFKIFVVIRPIQDAENPHWVWEMFDSYCLLAQSGRKDYDNRTLAECAAFEKAMAILEENLNVKE